MNQPSIELINVTKRYRIGQSSMSLRGLFSRRNGEEDKFHWAVNDLSFALQPGDALGIIGPNGAGKTTILKLLSKVTYPTSGTILVNGRFSALIELGAGFHPELTGRENVYLNGTILGMRRSEIDARFDEIVEFSGIGKYLDTPVKRYSSGMYARLGFSVAAHVDPEILLVDEVLAVGDMAFQKKCYDYMLKLIQKGTTIIFVSHNMRAIQQVCKTCIVMYRGNKAFSGSTGEATAEYSNILRQAAAEYQSDEEVEAGISQRIMTHSAVIEQVRLVRQDGEEAFAYEAGETARIQARILFKADAHSPVIACRISRPDGQVAYDYSTAWANVEVPDFTAGSIIDLEFSLQLNLVAGTYYIGVNVAYNDLSKYYDRLDRALDFVVTGANGARGVADLHACLDILPTEVAETDRIGGSG